MNTGITRFLRQIRVKVGSARLKRILIATAGILLILYFGTTVTAPLHEYQRISNTVFSDSVYMHQFSNHIAVHDSLLKKKALKEAWLLTATSDSISLLINLYDSVAVLIVKGVPIHNAHIFKFRIDGIIGRFNMPVYCKLFSQPHIIISEKSTIVKEPIIVKNAPKDTIEAANWAYMPDTLVKEPAFVAFTTNYNIKLVIEQNRRNSFYEKRVRWFFYINQYLISAWLNLRQLVFFRPPQYNPEILIALDADDIRTIYRALPGNALVVFTF